MTTPEEYDYGKLAMKMGTMADGHMCFLAEWFQEDLPLEDREGTAMLKMLQNVADEQVKVPEMWQHFQKDDGKKAPQFGEPVPIGSESVIVFSDSLGFCKGMLEKVPDGRVGKRKVLTDPAGSFSKDDIKALIGGKFKWDVLVFAIGMDPPKSDEVEDIIEQQDHVTKLFLAILLEIQKSMKVGRMVVLTRATFTEDPEIHAKAGLGLVTSAQLFGMCNSGRLELEGFPIHYIDTEWDMQPPYWDHNEYQLLERLASEVFRRETCGAESVRILNSGRFCLRQVASKQGYEVPGLSFQCPKKGVVCISGGNGALGLVMGEFLLDKAAEQRVTGLEIRFLSRSMRVADDNMPRWKAIQKRAAKIGVTVSQARCDTGNQDSIDDLFDEISPNLAGFIHSAGVLADSMLFNLTWEKFETVFESKHRAALRIHSALERYENPDFELFWNFSSVAVYGNMGQVNYSGSNSVLDCLARHRVGCGLPSMTIQWGAWGEVGMAKNMDAASRKRMEQSPMPYFSNREGIMGLEQGIATGNPYFACFKYNPTIMFGMIANNDPKASYVRNWTSEVFPLPAVTEYTPEQIYNLYHMSRGQLLDKGAHRLVKRNYNDAVHRTQQIIDNDEDLLAEARKAM